MDNIMKYITVIIVIVSLVSGCTITSYNNNNYDIARKCMELNRTYNNGICEASK